MIKLFIYIIIILLIIYGSSCYGRFVNISNTNTDLNSYIENSSEYHYECHYDYLKFCELNPNNACLYNYNNDISKSCANVIYPCASDSSKSCPQIIPNTFEEYECIRQQNKLSKTCREAAPLMVKLNINEKKNYI